MWLDNASDIDILFYDPYAVILSDISMDPAANPLTIGVFGAWGAGKSTLLKLVEQHIDENAKKNKKKIICANINAWMFESYEDAKTAIIEVLLRELQEKAKKANVKINLKQVFKHLDLFKLGTQAFSLAAPIFGSVISGTPFPLFLNITGVASETKNVVKEVADSLSEIKDECWKDDINEEDSIVNNIRNFRKEFNQALKDSEIDNIVVLIDDLDRCQPDRIIETLEAIRLFLSVEKTTFIIAADENVIKYAIKKKYPPVNGMNTDLDQEYIEKIIQLPIYIPELSNKDVENYLLLLVAQSYLGEESFKKLMEKLVADKFMISSNSASLENLNAVISELGLNWKNNSKKEYDDVSKVINSIKSIISISLKGNPRQAKRFLNTFITKRQLAQLYYGDELDMQILAKLLVLQKIDSNLFIVLNDWNKNFDTENVEFRKMREAVSNGEKIYNEWQSPQIKQWLNCKPVDLENKRLDKYFYLTRESLKKGIIDESLLSEAVRNILERLGTATYGLMPAIIKDLEMLSEEEISDVFKVILPKISKGEINTFVIRDLYLKFATYRHKIADALESSETGVIYKISDMPAFRAMYQEDDKSLEDTFSIMCDKNIISKKILEDIVKGK